VIPIIDDREVIPVRFIEFYTGRKIGPEATARILAQERDISGLNAIDKEDKLTAYHRHGDSIVPMDRKEWDSIVYAIGSLSLHYEKAGRHFDEWLKEALKLLPVAFVWRSEFDTVYFRSQFNVKKRLSNVQGYAELSDEETASERQLIQTPYIPVDLLDVVFEGFIDNGTHQGPANSAETNDFGVLVYTPVPDHELPPEIDIPIHEEEVEPDKQYPGRLPGIFYENLSVEEYIYTRRRDKPPASNQKLVYELRGMRDARGNLLSNRVIGELLDIDKDGSALKQAVQRLFVAEAKRLGTDKEIIEGRDKVIIIP
jgi:hypothetical protein